MVAALPLKTSQEFLKKASPEKMEEKICALPEWDSISVKNMQMIWALD